MFKTTIIAATLAASAAFVAPASAQLVPGSEYFIEHSDEASRNNVASSLGSTSVDAAGEYGYSSIVPGSENGERAQSQMNRADVRADTNGTIGTRVQSQQIVPGSDFDQ